MMEEVKVEGKEGWEKGGFWTILYLPNLPYKKRELLEIGL